MYSAQAQFNVDKQINIRRKMTSFKLSSSLTHQLLSRNLSLAKILVPIMPDAASIPTSFFRIP